MFETWQRTAEHFLWKPAHADAPYPARLAIRVLQFLYALVRDASEGQLTLRAMGLVYTTLLSLVPLIALSFSVLKGFGVHRQVEPVLYNFLQPLGDKGVELTDRVISFVDNVRVDVLGAVGLGVLVFTVISLVQKIESSFNYVWQIEQPRSMAQRFSEYLSVLVIGPVLMFVALGLIASISSNSLVQRVSEIEPFGSTLLLLGKLMPFVLVVLVFSFFYGFVPNTRVRVLSALTGGLVAGIVWATTGKLFASFVATSGKYTAVYSSFAIVILALIWLYINWLILLFGAQISYYHQHPLMLRTGHGRMEMANGTRERLALQIMYLVGEDFLHGAPRWSLSSLSQYLGLPGNALEPVLRRLRHAGLLTETETKCLVPGRDLARITLRDVVRAMRGGRLRGLTAHCSPQVDTLMDEIETSVGDTLANRTLREFVQPAAKPDEHA